MSSHSPPDQRIYLDHAATSPLRPEARAAIDEGWRIWANPSSPHAEGRTARAALEDARARIKASLGWDGELIFTSGASEAISIGLTRSKVRTIVTSPVEHDAVLRLTPDAKRLPVDEDGMVTETVPGALHAIQHVNNETGVIQDIGGLADRIHHAGGLLFCDCAQSAGKLEIPRAADLIAISAHKFGGPPGIGALLVRDLALVEPSGGQEKGYRGGTENLPAILGMAAALEQDRDWIGDITTLRSDLDAAIVELGGQIAAAGAARLPTIASYRMPGVSARAQIIRFDIAGIAISAGAACSSGTLKTSPVLKALGWDDRKADEVIRVSFGPDTGETDIAAFLAVWRGMAQARAA